MTPHRYKKLLDMIGLTQVGAGKFLGVDPRQSRRFAKGERVMPDMGQMLLEAMAAATHLKASELRELLTDPHKMRKLAHLKRVDGLNNPVGNPDWIADEDK